MKLHTIGISELSWSYSIQPFTQTDASSVVDGFISGNHITSNAKRILTEPQKTFLLGEFNKHPTPLYLRVACDIASTWTSFDNDFQKHLTIDQAYLQKQLETDRKKIDISPIKQVIARFYLNLAKKHGENLVRQTLRYLVASKHGLTSSEIVDLLSSNETVLTGDDVFKWWVPPVRRLPDALWKRLREDFGTYIADRGVYGLMLHQLYHRQFWETVELLFLPTDKDKRDAARHLAKFFNGDYSSPHLIPYEPENEAKQLEDRLVAPQPLSFRGHKFNIHKLVELPFQQVNSGDFDLLYSSLYNFEFIEAKLAAGMAAELMEDYRYAISHSQGHKEHAHKLTQFYRLLRRNQHILKVDPSVVLQLALNEPLDSTVSKAARSQRIRNACYSEKEYYDWITKPKLEDPCLLTFTNHVDKISTCAITPDGKKVVSGSVDHVLKVWDIESGTELFTLKGHSSYIDDCDISPDGKKIVSASNDNTLKIWDIQSGNELLTLKGHTSRVCTCAFSQYGKRIVSSSWDKTIKVWDVESGNELTTMKMSKEISACVPTQDGQKVVVSSYDGSLKLLNLDSGNELQTFIGHTSLVLTCAISLDGTKVVSGSRDNTLKVWDLMSGNQLITLKGHTEQVVTCTFSHDGKRVISGAWDSTLKLWDVETGTALCSLKGHTGSPSTCAFAPDDTKIVTGAGDTNLKVWNIENLPTLRGHIDKIEASAITPDGKVMIFGTSNDKLLTVWDIQLRTKLLTLEHPYCHTTCAMTHDGKRAISGSYTTLKSYDIELGTELCTFNGHTKYINTCAISRDGTRAVSGSQENLLKVWDFETGKELLTLQGHTSSVTICAVTPDSKKVVSGSYDRTLKVWDIESGEQLVTFKGHPEPVYACAITPDGKRVISGSFDRTLRMWDIETGKELLILEGHTDGVAVCTITQDGTKVISAANDRTIRVWNIQKGVAVIALV